MFKTPDARRNYKRFRNIDQDDKEGRLRWIAYPHMKSVEEHTKSSKPVVKQ